MVDALSTHHPSSTVGARKGKRLLTGRGAVQPMSRPIFSLTARVAIVGVHAPGAGLQLRQPPEEPPSTAREAAQVPPTPDHRHDAAREWDVQILEELERATRGDANEQALLALANPQLAFDGMM